MTFKVGERVVVTFEGTVVSDEGDVLKLEADGFKQTVNVDYPMVTVSVIV